jgi:acetyl esterase/lipase
MFTGHLAAAVALKLADSGKGPVIAAQVLRIPLTCHPLAWPGEKPPPKENMPVLTDSATVAMLGKKRKNSETMLYRQS